jgi:hypothetical protein
VRVPFSKKWVYVGGATKVFVTVWVRLFAKFFNPSNIINDFLNKFCTIE